MSKIALIGRFTNVESHNDLHNAVEMLPPNQQHVADRFTCLGYNLAAQQANSIIDNLTNALRSAKTTINSYIAQLADARRENEALRQQNEALQIRCRRLINERNAAAFLATQVDSRDTPLQSVNTVIR